MMTLSKDSKILFIDIETYSSEEITRGVYRYASSSDFEVLLIGCALNDEEIKVYSPLEELPKEIKDLILDDSVIKVAHNANFERVALSKFIFKKNNVYLKPDMWLDTMWIASTLGLPKSLNDLCKALELSSEDSKEKALGTILINFFSKPCRATKTNGYRTRNLPINDLAKWEDFKYYNKKDVVALRAIFKKMMNMTLPKWSINEREKILWNVDAKINDLGVKVDEEFITSIKEYLSNKEIKDLNRLKELTGLDNPNSREQILDYLRKSDLGLNDLNSFTKDTVSSLIEKFKNPKTDKEKEVLEVLTLEKQIKKTSNSKYDAMIESMVFDEKRNGYYCKGTLQFGFARTQRWSGRIIQVQNIPRNTLNRNEIAIIKGIIKDRYYSLFETLFDKPNDTISELIRSSLIPDDSSYFVVSDYNAIEGRVAAWVADEKWKLELFKNNGKLYEAAASRMFNIPIESIKHDSPERARGKVAELAGAYGGGVSAYKAFCPPSMGISDEELKEMVKSWREQNKEIVKMRSVLEDTIKELINNLKIAEICGDNLEKTYKKDIDIGENKSDKLTLLVNNNNLYIFLPSGRYMTYQNVKIEKRYKDKFDKEIEVITYEGDIGTTHKWGRVESYGGKFFENIVQSIARDCLADAIKALDDNNLIPCFHVHDEVIISINKNRFESKEKAIEEVNKILSESAGNYNSKIPLKAAGFTSNFYLKE